MSPSSDPTVGHVHTTKEVLLPFALLSFTLLATLYRYLYFIRPRAYYQPIISDLRQEDSSEAVTEPQRIKSGVYKAIVAINHIVALTFVLVLGVICIRSIVDHTWTGAIPVTYNVAFFIAVVANMVLMHLETTGGGHWSWPVYYFWWLALLGESLVILYHYWLFTKPEDPSGLSKDSSDGVTVTFEVDYVILFRVVFLVRYALWWMLALLSLVHAAKERRDDDLEALRAIDTGAPGYGTFGTNGTAGASGRTRPITSSSSDEEIRKRLSAEEEERANAFKDFWPKIKRLLPFVYPREKSLQLLILLTFVLIGLGRVVNLLVPIMTEKIVRDLNQNNPRFDVGAILLYVLVRFLQGSSGLVGALRGWAWIPIEQYSNRTLTLRFFEHVQNLSLQFHLNRKTGELLRILDRGTSSIVSLLSTVLFQLVPVIADVTIAVVYFCKYWSWKYAVIVFITIISYIIVTVVVTEWRTRFRRAMISFDNDARAKAVDSLLNFETVKYYTAEHFEQERYREAIEKYQTADYKSQVSYQLLNLLQSFVITMGMLAGCLLCAYEISRGERDVSSFVTFIVYLNQLYQPLNWFGTYYRMLQQNFVDMEKMIKLLDENQSVKDVPGAGRLVVTGGEVVFENVCFQYDSRQKGLSNVSFRVPKGKTVALVGPTGSGKSTILRLLFRFYDVNSGRILIDGQDITLKTQTSLREQIGVVPQDSVLFNDTIYYNINYGRTSATQHEVEAAAKAAQIHDKVVDFPEGYNTRVGERGLRLSGGEKQRVAIARTILKNPPIVLLDEATSALDSVTESQIQAALSKMTENRTTLVVAHRLSTVINADLILCIKDGRIVEQGTHDQLVEMAMSRGGEGVYYEMWKQQIKEEQEAVEETVQALQGESNT